MTQAEKNGEVVRYWLAKAGEALLAARDDLAASRPEFAVNRCYYAAFYAASAVLLSLGHHFVKHSGVRSALHQHVVKAGLLETQWGHLYDQLFEERTRGDYVAFTSFDTEDVRAMLARTERLVELMGRLVRP